MSGTALDGPRRWRGWLCLLVLNLLLFVPAFVFARTAADWLPFTPERHSHGPFGWDLRSAHQYLLALGLRRDNPDVFRFCGELALLLAAAIWTGRSRSRRGVRAGLVTLYLCLLSFLVYHHAVAYFFSRPPALSEDLLLSLNLVHYLGAVMSSQIALTIGASLAAAVGIVVLAVFGFGFLQLEAAGWSRRAKLWLSLALLTAPLASLAWFGLERADTVFQWTSKSLFDNWRTSRAESARMASLRSGGHDRRYAAISGQSLRRKPNFYLLMIEAYGEVLATSDMREAYRALLARVEARLGQAGYHAYSAYSAAPVHGGTSWFSIATVHTGVLIDRPIPYESLQHTALRIPSITRFFRSAGYRTHTLQPGTTDRTGLRKLDMFNHDVVLTGPTLAYQGPRYGFGGIPDQYSIGALRERVLQKAPATEPRYLFYMAVSTHYPWASGDVPPYVRDWHALDRGQVEPSDLDASWPSLPGKAAIATDLRHSYFRSVEYEWRVLTEWLEAEPGELVVVVIGDHQPRLEPDATPRFSMNTPVHVLSRDAAFVARFASEGFEPGLYADPERPNALRHEGMFSLWASKLVAAYGEPGAPTVTYHPAGIGLAGLNP